jgi:hypothetical protein
MGEKRGVYRFFVVKPERKGPLGRSRHRWEYNIKMDLQEVGFGGKGWVYVGHSMSSEPMKNQSNL